MFVLLVTSERKLVVMCGPASLNPLQKAAMTQSLLGLPRKGYLNETKLTRHC